MLDFYKMSQLEGKMRNLFKSSVVRIALVLFCLFLQSCAHKTPLQFFAQTDRGKENIVGWEKVRWGMSVDEVNRLYPLKGSFKADSGLFEPGLKKVDGHFSRTHLISSPFYWDKLPILVLFYFDSDDGSGRLVRVKVMTMTEYGKVEFEQSPIHGLFRFMIKKYGWPYRYHATREGRATDYYWKAQSGMILARYSVTKNNDGQWNHLFTVNYLSKVHPCFSSRYSLK